MHLSNRNIERMTDMFVDTNVLIDVLTNRDGAEYSKRLFAYAKIGRVRLSISALSLVNAMYICKRYNMNQTAVADALKIITTFVEVKDLTARNTIMGLSSDWSDYEDFTQSYCATEHSISYIVTRNAKDFSKSTAVVLSPEEALRMLIG